MSNLEENIDDIEQVTDLESLQFFQTQPHPCSYLEEQTASTVFLSPKQSIDRALYSQLSDYGFRRSGQHIYKPLCANCNACVPLRVPVDLFEPNRNQKRTWKRNSDLVVTQVNNIDTPEHYALYERYINQRHSDGDMYPPSEEQFRDFLSGHWHSTHFYEFRNGQQLLAVSIADIMDNGISAVYTYYEPNEPKRSLGSFAILYLINTTKKHHLRNLYLGYWIKESEKMNYKASYRPLEIQSGDRWLLAK